ncbi:MAG: 50S ribosomal protein L25/general stress protein Ctc [Bacteroidales bacterium]|nr:50S ribosomal protein L25/general stress protein Ctc [Bacteroidales bacterium]
MKTLEIKGPFRESTGKKDSKQLRKAGNVPCVLYGGEENVHFYTHQINFKKLIYTTDAHLVKLVLGDKHFDAVVQDIQFHPVRNEIIHVDFVQVFKEKAVTVNLPIILTGSSIGLKNGGKLRQNRRHMKISALVDNIPDHLDIDMTDVDIGDFLKVGDLEYENIEILDPPRAMVVGIVSSRLVAKGLRESVEELEEEVAAAAAAAAAGVEEGAEEAAADEGQAEDQSREE